MTTNYARRIWLIAVWIVAVTFWLSLILVIVNYGGARP